MTTASKPYTIDRIMRIGIVAGLLWGVVRLLGVLSDVLIPFAAALLLAYLVHPLVLWVQKKISNRTAAVFITLLTLAASIILIAWLVIPMVVNEMLHMGHLLSELVNNSGMMQRAAERLPPNLWEIVRDLAERKEVQEFFSADSLSKIIEFISHKVLPGVWGIITGTASFIMALVGLAVIGLYMIFLLLDYERVKGWKNLLPSSYKDTVISFVDDFNAAMSRYFRAQAAVAGIVGVLFAAGFLLIGLPMSILLGLLIGLLNMVPYLQIIGLVPAFLLAVVHVLETGSNFWVIVGLTGGVFVVVQLIQDAVLVPKIMGRVTGLSPAMILLSLSIWGKLLGLFGLLIALPVTCLILAYYQRYLAATEAKEIPIPQV